MGLKTGSGEEPIAVVLARRGRRARLAQVVERQRAEVAASPARLAWRLMPARRASQRRHQAGAARGAGARALASRRRP
jgi:hypothetical protein